MAITQLNTADFDYQMMLNVINKSYKGKSDITISEYDSTAAPEVKVGSVFDINGAIFIVDTSDITPSGYGSISNSTTFYLYYDEDPGAFIYSSTAPTWNDALQGHYNGNDRAFFSMYKDSGGTLYRNKVQFRAKDVLPTQGIISITNSETVVLERGHWNITLWDTPDAGHDIAIRLRVNGTLRTIAFRQNGVSDFQSLGAAVFSDGTGGVEISGTGTGSYNCYYQRL